jgi:hypothetical protein
MADRTIRAYTNLTIKVYSVLLHDVTVIISGLQSPRGVAFEFRVRALYASITEYNDATGFNLGQQGSHTFLQV